MPRILEAAWNPDAPCRGVSGSDVLVDPDGHGWDVVPNGGRARGPFTPAEVPF